MKTGASRESVSKESETARLVEGAGAALMFIGAYVPWVVTFALFTSVPVRGVDTSYGRVLPLIPLFAVGLLAWRSYVRRARWVHLVIIVLGVLSITLATLYVIEVNRNLARAQQSLARSGQVLPGTVRVRFDVGIYLTGAGGAAMLIGGILGIRRERSPRGLE